MLSKIRDLLRRFPVAPGHPAFGVTLGLVVGLTVLALTGFTFSRPQAAEAPAGARPAPVQAAALVAQPISTDGDSLIRLQDLSPEAARIWNASNPISDLPNPAARPFLLKAEGVIDEARAVDCMTAAIYYEAAYESADGQRAVAQVVLNRMRHPAYPKTVCGVVFQGSERASGCQFTFTCDGALARKPTEEGWERARKVAIAALNGYVMKPVGNATHYHADYVAPYWSPNLVKVATIGAHIFYRWTGTWGQPPAFAGRYAGGESVGVQLAKLDTIAQEQARLSVSYDEVAPIAAAEAPAHVEEASAVAPVEETQADLVTAAEAAPVDPKTILPPEDLDWQGRPRDRGPRRIAIPSAAGPPKF